MESKIKSSFIPQDAGKQARPKPSIGDGSDLLMLGAIILLMASLTLAGGVFLYSKYLGNSIAVKQSSIDRARAAIEPALIEELSRLDIRMRSSDALLGRHVSMSTVFSLLEQITLQSIELTELGIISSGSEAVKIVLKGAAKSVNSIALQSDLYGKSGIITSPIFSDINRKSNGLTQFRVDALLNLNAIRYRNLIAGGRSIDQAAAEEEALLQQQVDTEETTPFGAPPSGESQQ